MKMSMVGGFCFLLACLVGVGSAHAQEVKTKTLPSSAWQVLEQARGIHVGGSVDARPSIQVIFDANCPYCARLYETLRRDHPEVAVRWVPIAYFRADSAQLAAAIINSADPAGSLQKNFGGYDYRAHRGGYRIPQASPFPRLGDAQDELKRHWKKWGGYTPMFVFRDKQGRTRQTGGSAAYIVKEVLKNSAKPLQAYLPASSVETGK